MFLLEVIALQYCASFCHIANEPAAGIHKSPPSWTPLPSPTPSCPSKSSHSSELSSACDTADSHLLRFTYDNVYVSMLFSQFPTLSFPSFSTSLFSLSESPLAPWGSLVSSFYIPYTCINIQCLSLSDLLCMIGSRFTHLFGTDSNALFVCFYSWLIFHCIYYHNAISIPLSMDF